MLQALCALREVGAMPAIAPIEDLKTAQRELYSVFFVSLVFTLPWDGIGAMLHALCPLRDIESMAPHRLEKHLQTLAWRT